MEENYEEILTEHSKIIIAGNVCYFCHKIDSANYFIDIGKYFVCDYCWKRFVIFVKEWFEHDVLK